MYSFQFKKKKILLPCILELTFNFFFHYYLKSVKVNKFYIDKVNLNILTKKKKKSV